MVMRLKFLRSGIAAKGRRHRAIFEKSGNGGFVNGAAPACHAAA
jgi:hypothetical protein